LHPEMAMNALSRKDNETFICNACAWKEAEEELAALDAEKTKDTIITYSEPKQDARGFWICEVTNGGAMPLANAKYTTKKGLLDWIKKDKKERSGNE